MKSFNFKEKITGGKNVYILAAVSFFLTAIVIGIVYSQTVSTIEKSLSPLSTTQQVNINQQGESDPRKNYRITTVASSSEAKETTTEEVTEKETEESTTEKLIETTEVSVAAVQSFIMPHDGEIIRKYSPDIPVYCETMNDWRTHNGIDIALGEGEEVLSVGNGKVQKVIADSSYGYTIEVDYGSFVARYCGMKQGECVGINDVLQKGDSIGIVDSVPCERESKHHLHFEIVKDGQYEDPSKILLG